VIDRGSFEIRPELSLAYGFTDIGDVNFDTTTLGSTDGLINAIDGVDFGTLRLAPEFLIPLESLSEDAILEFKPSLLCECTDGDRACGAGLRIGLHGTSDNNLATFGISVDADRLEKTTRVGLSASIEYRF